PELQRPDLLVSPPGSAVAFVVVERAEIAGIQDGDAGGQTKRDDLIGGVMQRVACHALDFFASAMPCVIQALTPSRPGFRAGAFLPELGLGFRTALLDGPEAPTGYRE
ncbi:hypothetical protein, partial [Sulfobacillus harzensis]